MELISSTSAICIISKMIILTIISSSYFICLRAKWQDVQFITINTRTINYIATMSVRNYDRNTISATNFIKCLIIWFENQVIRLFILVKITR
jgi:hypothetical protein